MARHGATARPGRDRESDCGYTEGKRPMPTEGEDRMESIYHNPVGAQCGMPLEGQGEIGAGSRNRGRRMMRFIPALNRLRKNS